MFSSSKWPLLTELGYVSRTVTLKLFFFARPLLLLPGSSIVNILCPIHLLSLLTWAVPLIYSLFILTILLTPSKSLNIFSSTPALSFLLVPLSPKHTWEQLTHCCLMWKLVLLHLKQNKIQDSHWGIKGSLNKLSQGRLVKKNQAIKTCKAKEQIASLNHFLRGKTWWNIWFGQRTTSISPWMSR